MSFGLSSAIPGDLGYNGYPVLLSYFTAIPDVALLSDANVAVIFKSLLKKNSVTKEKNLNDLIKVLEDGTTDVRDDLLVMCWIQLYPKLGLDNSRTVRILAHQVQATFLRVIGGKEFSKHLKCSVPLWLQSLFDTDKPVSNSSYKDLLLSFQNDKDRVDNKIWIVFHEQIINYIHTVVCVETHESISDQRYVKQTDSLAKYDRALNGAMQMLVKLIELASDGDFILPESMVKIDEVLGLDRLWEGLLTCVAGENINMALFKTYLVLLKSVFALRPDNSPQSFTLKLGDIKGVYKVVSKRFIKSVKLKIGGTTTSSVVYSNVILQLWDTLGALTGFTLMEATTKKSLKIKKNFWELGGSKSYSRLKEYLKLGYCLSDPVYFLVLKSFFQTLAKANVSSDDEFEFVDFSSSKDANAIVLKILSPQVFKLGFAFKKTLADCIFTVCDLFQDETLLLLVFWCVLDGISSPRIRKNEELFKKECVQLLASFSSKHDVDFKSVNLKLVEAFTSKTLPLAQSLENTFIDVVQTYFCILLELQSHETQEDLLGQLLTCNGPEEGSLKSSIFTIFSNFLKSSDMVSSQISEWAPTLPDCITEGFVKQPLELLGELLQKKYPIDFKLIIESFFTRLSTESEASLPELFLLINKYDVFDSVSFESSFPGAHTYLVLLSKKQPRSDLEDEVVYKYLADSDIFANLISSCSSNESSALKFILSFVKNEVGTTPAGMESELLEIVMISLKSVDLPASAKFLSLIDNEKLVKESVLNLLFTSQFDFKHLAAFISENSHFLPLDDIKSAVTKALEHIDLPVIALANPLAQNIHLIEFSGSSSQLFTLVLSISKFVRELLKISSAPSNELLLLAGICAEYLQDYNFLVNVDSSDEAVLDLKISLSTLFTEHILSEPSHLVETINGSLRENQDPRVSILETLGLEVAGNGPFTPLQFFYARILVQHLNTVLEPMSLSSFDALEIQYTKLANNPLKLSVFLTSASKFIGQSKKFDRIRNFVFGEILGVKSSAQIMTLGKTWITLAINFLNVDEKYEIMPKHKMGMLINHISDWLESDIAYDPAFIPMRSLLAVFFTSLIPLNEDLPEKMWEQAVDLCLNNLSTAQVESREIELRYFSMKLFVRLSNSLNDDLYPQWSESKNSILEELVELMINKDIEEKNLKANNQPVILGNELMERILKKVSIPKSVVADNNDKFYDLLSTSKFLNLQRLATSFLHKYVLETQQDFVVEYQLRKSNLGDGTTDDDTARLPAVLVSNVSQFKSDLGDVFEDEEFHTVAKFLWSWLLIFDHFKDTTFAIRSDHINQLKSSGCIEDLFKTIFGVVDITNNAFLKKLVSEPIDKKVKINPENCLIQFYNVSEGCIGESVLHEMHFLLVHLYYLSFQYLGSFVQLWFNEIRDLQLKQQVEKFSVRFVSPLLISRMLTDVETAKTKLTDSDDNLTIKVNKVTNEIKSVYLIDEQIMEMVVKIPDTFPLSNVSVQGPLRLGVKENQWKAWLLASQRVVSLTNGSIIECIELFNKNISLHFSGFEECSICYSILHQDHSLPSKVCPLCLNKFHAACLYKWFKSSGSSTCPLCRSSFNFKAARA